MSKPEIPQDQQAEGYVIGYLLAQDGFESLFVAQGIGVSSKAFISGYNAFVWEAIESLSNSADNCSIVGVADKLKENGRFELVGGYKTLSDLAGFVGSIAFTQSCERIVALMLRREVFNVCKKGALKSCDEAIDIDATLGELDLGVATVGKTASGDTTKKIEVVHDEVMPEFEKMINGEHCESGVMTGIPTLDRLTNGLQRGDMIVVGARPSVGKTSLVMNFIENVLRKGGSSLFFSLEMDNRSIFKKLVCTMAKVSLTRLQDGFVSLSQRDDLKREADFVRASNFWINDNSDLTINQIRSIARQKSHRHKLDLIVIDYIQFVRIAETSKQNREQAVSEVSRGIKAMAKELNVPVVALSQLNRESDKSDRRPKLSDLRDSGGLEQDLDVGVFLWPNKEEGCVELQIAKNRKGATGFCKLSFDALIQKFTEIKQ